MPRKIELLAGYWTIAGDCYAMGPSEVSPFPLKERVEAASAAGYTGLGLVHQDLVFNAKVMGYPAMKRLFDDHGIVHIEVEFLGDWFESCAKRETSDRVRKDLLEAADALSARDIKCAGEMWATRASAGTSSAGSIDTSRRESRGSRTDPGPADPDLSLCETTRRADRARLPSARRSGRTDHPLVGGRAARSLQRGHGAG